MQRLGNFFYEIHNVIKYFFRVNMTGKMCATVTSQNATKSQKGGFTKEQPYIVRRNKGRRGKKWRGWRRGGPGGARWMGTLPAICPDVRSVRSLSGWPALLKAAFCQQKAGGLGVCPLVRRNTECLVWGTVRHSGKCHIESSGSMMCGSHPEVMQVWLVWLHENHYLLAHTPNVRVPNIWSKTLQ